MKAYSCSAFPRSMPMMRALPLFLGALLSLPTLQASPTPATPNMFGTLAGTAGDSGASDGNGRESGFSIPRGLAVDSARNVYVADSANHTIRKITPAGVVTTVAGAAGQSGSTDGVGRAARFNYPVSVAIDHANNLYVADQRNSTIRKITAAGVVTTLAGSADHAGANDGRGEAAQFNNPNGVAVDSAANVYVADCANCTIRKITADGVVTTVAGQAGVSGSSDGMGLRAQFAQPRGLTVDVAGNVFVVDSANHAIRKITPTGEVTTLAGRTGVSGTSDGSGIAALFTSPSGIASDEAGNLFVTDTGNHTIRRISADGEVTTIAGVVDRAGSADGAGNVVSFNQPAGVAINAWGDLYVADAGNHTIREGYVFYPEPAITGLSSTKQVLAPGQGFVLSVAAAGIGPLSYQWSHNGRTIAGATGTSISETAVNYDANGDYAVAVTDDLGTNQKTFYIGVGSAVTQVDTEQNKSAL